MREIRVPIRRVEAPRAAALPPPSAATSGSAGCDLRAAIERALELAPGGRARVPVGFAVAIPAGYEGQVRPRSGLAHEHGVTVLNAPGTIDSDYRGELQVVLINHGEKPYRLHPGDRIAQLVIGPVVRVRWDEGGDALGETERGDGGFGHSGRA